MKDKLKDEMLETIFVQTGGRDENPKIADLCADIAVKFISSNLPVSKSLAPHRCPICGGNGLVSGAFYTALLGCGGTSTNITQQCRQCEGQGVLWG